MSESDSDDIRRLLTEIRDLQQAHLDEYREAARRGLELQERAVDRQAQATLLSKIATGVAAALIIGIVILIVYLLAILQPYV